MKLPQLLLPLLASGFLTTAFADAVKDREGAVRKDKAEMQNDARWIYNDWHKGFAEAKRTGKPLLIVLRCVPCLSCMGLDASVLTSTALTPLLDQFVCVRLINANAIELAKFQFDYDLSFSTLFFNADGTLYGRYGSWSHQKDPTEKTTLGYQRSLEAALAIHTAYPVNKAALAGKQGSPTPFATPVEIPLLAGKYKRDLDWEGKVVGSCVHCHQIGDAYRSYYRDAGKPLPNDLIYPMPMPETVGVTLEPDHIAKVKSVVPGSIAAKAGVNPGDDFISVGGQLLLSIADFAWALHRAPESGPLAAKVKRGPSESPLTFTLPAGWRTKSDISKRVGTWPMRAMALGGMTLVDLPDSDRATRGLAKDKLALHVKGLGQYNKHAAAKNAGFQKDDVLLELNGKSARATEGELIGQILQSTRPGEKLKATVLRGDQRVELLLPMQ
ncbi:MAG: PDZ domain-containing protein [Verrucomicrobia bacterium]|nr:PDZ domain-containing protein [Verrucomicrobiota bacterium]